MNDLRDQTQPLVRARSAASVFMQHVYLWMTAALGVTAVAAYVTATSPTVLQLFYGNMFMPILMIVAIFGLVIYLSAAMHKLSAGAATGFFMLYAALMGIFLGPVLLRLHPLVRDPGFCGHGGHVRRHEPVRHGDQA